MLFNLKTIPRTLWLLLLAGMYSPVHAANITAHVDHNPVLLDETFVLTLEADGAIDAEPDFSVLKKNFSIIDTSSSTSVNIINGEFSRKNAWQITLLPQEVGVFTIPSVPFGRDSSPALLLTVKDTRSNVGKLKDKQLYLEVETDVKQTWVQAQIIYTMRIVRSINISNPSISQLKTSDPDAIIESLGKDNTYEAIRNGVRYIITELKLAVYPQHSGKLTFEPVQFQARVADSSRRSFFDFDPFGQRGKIKRIKSKSLTVDVQPHPPGFSASNWLPASELKLADSWTGDTDQLRVGEPLTRTITLVATGLPAAQLPDISLADIDGLKQYPDQPALDDTKSASGITGAKTIKLAFIATRDGSFRLPAISIPWWNTKTGQQQVARLPEVILNASGAAQATPPPGTTTTATPQLSQADTGSAASPVAGIDAGLWPWISLALAVAWLLTLTLLFTRYRSGPAAQAPTRTPTTPALGSLEKNVLSRARASDAHGCKDALLAWARARWPDDAIASLADIGARTSPELRAAIDTLNSALYSRDSAQWHGAELAQAFKSFKKHKADSRAQARTLLEPLYKT